MVSRLFLGPLLIWVLVELAAVVALASTIGLGWTLLVLLGTFVVGLAVAGSQIKRRLSRLRSELTAGGGTARLRGPVTDGAVVVVAALLVAVPGLVTTAVGLLLLLPPTRVVARPILTALATRSFGRPLLTVTTFGADHTASARQSDVIDGEVIDVTDVEPLALPPRAE
jgi:UPF0716 protein FxsA